MHTHLCIGKKKELDKTQETQWLVQTQQQKIQHKSQVMQCGEDKLKPTYVLWAKNWQNVPT